MAKGDGAILRRVAIPTTVFVIAILTSSCADVLGMPNTSPPPAAQIIYISTSASCHEESRAAFRQILVA
jgi:hypothetical protein